MSTPVHCGEDGEHPAHRPPFRGLGVNTLLEDTHSHSKFAHIGFVGLYSRLAEATVSVMRPTLLAAVLATSIDRTVASPATRVEEPIPPRSAGFPFTQPPVPRRRKLAHGMRGCRCIWLDPRQAGRLSAGISTRLVRLSVGLKSAHDVIADLLQNLDTAQAGEPRCHLPSCLSLSAMIQIGCHATVRLLA